MKTILFASVLVLSSMTAFAGGSDVGSASNKMSIVCDVQALDGVVWDTVDTLRLGSDKGRFVQEFTKEIQGAAGNFITVQIHGANNGGVLGSIEITKGAPRIQGDSVLRASGTLSNGLSASAPQAGLAVTCIKK